MKTFAIIILAILLFSNTSYSQDFLQVDPQAKELFNKAIEQDRMGQMESAIELAVLAYRKDKGILALNDNGFVDRIEKYLNEKISKDPQNMKLLYRKAKLQAVRGRTQEAADLLTKVLRKEGASDLGNLARDLLKRMGPQFAEMASRTATMKEMAAAEPTRLEKDNRYLDGRVGELERENARLKQEKRELEYKFEEQQTELQQLKEKMAAVEAKAKEMKLYNALFWANPTNAYLMEKNYSKQNIKRDIINRGAQVRGRIRR